MWFAFSWFEADREIKILCSLFRPGLECEKVFEILETGEYLRYRGGLGPDEPVSIDSLYNLGRSRCVVEFESDRVVAASYEASHAGGP